jgi:hypothetical protein
MICRRCNGDFGTCGGNIRSNHHKLGGRRLSTALIPVRAWCIACCAVDNTLCIPPPFRRNTRDGQPLLELLVQEMRAIDPDFKA